QLERVVFQFPAHHACGRFGLHALESVEHNQMRATVAQAALQPLEASSGGRVIEFAEKELTAFADERVCVGLLVERPHQHAAGTGRWPSLLQTRHYLFSDGGL